MPWIKKKRKKNLEQQIEKYSRNVCLQGAFHSLFNYLHTIITYNLNVDKKQDLLAQPQNPLRNADKLTSKQAIPLAILEQSEFV